MAIRKVFDLGTWPDTERIKLRVEKTGEATATVSWEGGPRQLIVYLEGPGQMGPYAREYGQSPINLAYTFTPEDIAKGEDWVISVYNRTWTPASDVTIIVDLPEVIAEVPPSLIPLTDAFVTQLKGITPGFESARVTFDRDAVLAQLQMADAQSILRSAGIVDLSKIETLTISRNIVVSRAGVMQPRDVERHGEPTAQDLEELGSLARTVFFSALPDEFEQDQAVLIGKRVDLRNSRLVISENIAELYIITEEIVGAPNAEITWHGVDEVVPAPKSYNYSKRQHESSFKNFNPTVETTASTFGPGPHGEHGRRGVDGQRGYSGKPAPTVRIITLSFSGVPKINLRGGPGGPGENGQGGEDGGNGSKGLHAASGLFDCRRGPGQGGHGGNGGSGGHGGDGGSGGQGGKIYITATVAAFTQLLTSGFVPIISGGAGGMGGRGGAGGNPGRGGDPGKPDGWCEARPDRRGVDGQPGPQGATGRNFVNEYGTAGEFQGRIITEDEFLPYLTQPALLRLHPSKSAPGKLITAYGINLIDGDNIIFDDMVLADARFLTDNQIAFSVPEDVSGGFHDVTIRRGTTYTNAISLEVTPYVESVAPLSISPGGQVTITGKAFLPGANVILGDKEISPISSTKTQLTFEIPTLNDGLWVREEGGTRKVMVHNPHPSDEVSNAVDLEIMVVYGLSFDPKIDGWSFSNTQVAHKGVPSWDTLCRTFGEDEVILSIPDPLFWAFYGFYKWFVKGPYGLCTGMATTSLERFRSGSHNTHNLSISQAIQEITIAFGHMVGIEQLRRFNGQVESGVDGVKQTFETVEEFFKRGTDLRQAPILMFLPSGSIWPIERLQAAHTVVPYKIVYEDKASQFPARMYIYNNNYPFRKDDYVRFFERGGKVHFQYSAPGGGALEFSTDHGHTLGASSLQFMLLSDADMPISLIAGGQLAIETAFSPIYVCIQNEDGETIGYADAEIHLEMPGALFIPFAPNCYVLPFGKRYTRTIEGADNGVYSYSITNSEGFSITLKNISIEAGSVDRFTTATDSQALIIQPGQNKSFNITIAQSIGQESRIIELDEVELERDEEFLFWVDNSLDEFGVSNLGKRKPLSFKLRHHENRADQEGTTISVPTLSVEPEEHLRFESIAWDHLNTADVLHTIATDKALIPQRFREEFGR
jgi:hypothetical protein